MDFFDTGSRKKIKPQTKLKTKSRTGILEFSRRYYQRFVNRLATTSDPRCTARCFVCPLLASVLDVRLLINMLMPLP